MKKLFTLCMSLLLAGTMGVQAQIVTDEELDQSFVFTDLDGNEIDDGAVIVVNELNAEGQMKIPLKAKNITGDKVAVSLYEDIHQMPNGSWQTCTFGNCMQLTQSGYSPKNIMDVGHDADIETEWIPETYGTWTARLQLHIFNITTKTQFGKTIETAGNEIIGYGPVVTVRFEYKDPNAQPAEMASLILGPYTSDAVAEGDAGLGLNINSTLGMAALLPCEDFMMFDGGKVTKMRVGLANSAEITRVFISGFDGQNIVELMSQEVSLNAAGWNEVELNEPLTLDMSAYSELLIGYDYTQVSGQYPISVVQEGATIYDGITYGPLGQNGATGWFNIGLSSYGNLSVQCVVESDKYPEKDLGLGNLLTDLNWYKSGSDLKYSFNVQNMGLGMVSASTYTVEIDDEAVGTLSSDIAVGSQETKEISGSLTLPATLLSGEHKLSLLLTGVDGAAPAGNIDNDGVSTKFKVYDQSVARQKNLLEQFTSQYCTYCPRGVTFFSDLIGQRDDIAWVSVHGDMSSGSDVFTIAAGDTISYYEGVTGFPTASFNRTYVPDMASSEGEIAYSLGYNMSYRTQVVEMFSSVVDWTAEAPSFVTLGIAQVYNPESRELTITVEGKGVESAAEVLTGYGLTVMLTENGLTARQLNEGKWNEKFEHHYVLRGVLGKCTGNAINWQGDDFTATFTYTIPEDYQKDNMYVVAFVAPMITLGSTSTMDMAVNNCEMVAVKDAESTAIRTVAANGEAQVRYSLDGRQLPKAQKGLNLVRTADGNVKKVVVK